MIFISSVVKSSIFEKPCTGEPCSDSVLVYLTSISLSSDTLLLKPSCGAALFANPSNTSVLSAYNLFCIICNRGLIIIFWKTFFGIPGTSSIFSSGDKKLKLGEFDKYLTLSSRICAILSSVPSELSLAFFLKNQILDFYILEAMFITYNINDYYT